MLVEVGIILFVFFCIKLFTKSEQERLLGLYSQPGPFYWIKWLLVNITYRWRRGKAETEDSGYDDGSDLRYLEDETEQAVEHENDVGVGVHKKSTPAIMERTRPVLDSPFFVDAVYFNAFEEKSASITDDITLILEFSMRHRNYAEILFFINMPGIGFLQHPSHPDRIICDAWTDDYTYNGQGIQIEMLEPMRRWKIRYNGLMRVAGRDSSGRKISNSGNEMVHVKCSLIWRSYSSVIDFDTEIHPTCIANAFALEPWHQDFFKNIKKYHSEQSHYEQWGQMQGNIQVDEQAPRTVLLRGARDRSFGRRDWNHFHRYIIFMIHLEDGTSINASIICMDAALSRLSMGYIIQPNRRKDSISRIDLNLWDHGEDGEVPKKIRFNFFAGGLKYSVMCQIRIIPDHYCGFQWEGRLHENLADFHVNGIPGRGIAQMYYRQERRILKVDRPVSLKKYNISEAIIGPEESSDAIILKFEDGLCWKDSLVGGKGSQLAVLTKWSRETERFAVPVGFCLTTEAFKIHLKENPAIDDMIKELSSIPCSSGKNLKEGCEKVTAAFQNLSVSSAIRESLENSYRDLELNGQASVAVRSSAVGEDSTDLSAAGQLETFLGVQGIDKVTDAVKKCWGCQYTYNAVQYRKQHGQPVYSTMGVVVQVMVESPLASGVMFTQHPVTGNPSQIMINANYGLGESVVSGSAEPDTIVVACSPNNNTEILSRNVGSKEEMILIEEGEMRQIRVSEKECGALSLTDKQIFELADIGVTIQTYFGSPKDIEWAISPDGKINLLQARPITSDPTETEYEILHEFDSAFTNENSSLTTANITEMMPGNMTTLTASTFLRAIEFGTQDFYCQGTQRKPMKYNEIYTNQSHTHPFLNYLEMLAMTKEVNVTSRKDSFDVSVFGTICNEVSAEDAKKYHDSYVVLPIRIWNSVRLFKNILSSKKAFVELIDKAQHLTLTANTSKALYRVISENLAPYYAESWRRYLSYAALSGLSNTMLMMIMSKGQSEWTTAHYSDVATIYASCYNVVSVDAPALLNKTAKLIHQSGEKEKFLSMSPQDAIDWLIQQTGDAGSVFQTFLAKCGHRCIKEAEMRVKSWADDPGKLGASLQALVANFIDDAPKSDISVDEVIAKIKTPVSKFERWLLKWAIPKARESVGGREWGKSKAVEMTYKFKRAYWKLAEMMEKEEYLPDADLMFFLSHGEIGKLLRTRSAKLITRAHKRRRLSSHASELIFPELSLKVPVSPVCYSAEDDVNPHQLHIQGCPVSHGVVKGSARVVLNLADANDIKKGDILIVRTTDVGWSPYFPLIAGLVTEIGGLVSHGAVVAREYGLPCIVSAKKATKLFRSGDYVQLNGGNGTLRKLG